MPKPVAQIRREHFLAHVERAGGIAEFVKKYDEAYVTQKKKHLNPDYLRQLCQGAPKPGTNLGASATRAFEKLVGDPPGSWDQDMDLPSSASIEELQHAIGALYTVVGIMRPDAGAVLRATLMGKAPPSLFRATGKEVPYLTRLLEGLDVAVQQAGRNNNRGPKTR